MFSRSFSPFTTAISLLSLGRLVSAQIWDSAHAIRGVDSGSFPWVEAIGSPLDVSINYVDRPDSGFELFQWFIQSVGGPDDPPNFVTLINPIGGFATPFGGEPRVCGGQGMLLKSMFTGFPTTWKLTPLGGNEYKISTNVTTPNSGETELFWSIHASTGLLPLDPEDMTSCSDTGSISQIFQIIDPIL